LISQAIAHNVLLNLRWPGQFPAGVVKLLGDVPVFSIVFAAHDTHLGKALSAFVAKRHDTRTVE
jgi:hypothetical protein